MWAFAEMETTSATSSAGLQPCSSKEEDFHFDGKVKREERNFLFKESTREPSLSEIMKQRLSLDWSMGGGEQRSREAEKEAC